MKRHTLEARGHGSALAAVLLGGVFARNATLHPAGSPREIAFVQRAYNQFHYAYERGWRPEPGSDAEWTSILSRKKDMAAADREAAGFGF